MADQRGYRQRRIAVAVAAIALLAIGQRERPTLGTISITIDGRSSTPSVTAALAPPLDTLAAFVAVTIDKMGDTLTR